jgi:putative ABC transport system ATP-binding protein
MIVQQTLQVSKTFGEGAGQVHALRGVDMTVRAGEFVAVMGPSGCGKSTLLHLLGGLERPTSGRVLLEGQDLSDLNEQQRSVLRRRRMGFIFQRFNLLPNLSAVENVALPLRLDGLGRRAALERAKQALDLVGVGQRAGHRPAEMSGGEAQRAAIARAVVIDPAILLADEPTGALDSGTGRHIVGLFRFLVVEHKQTVLVVTHDVNIAAAADRTIYLRDGQIERETIGTGTIAEPARLPEPLRQP